MEKHMKFDYHDFYNMSVDELNNLIAAATDERDARIEREKRARKAEEYESKIYDLIEQARFDNFTVRINDELITNAYDISVEP